MINKKEKENNSNKNTNYAIGIIIIIIIIGIIIALSYYFMKPDKISITPMVPNLENNVYDSLNL
jgi:uncharacterized membrane protein YkgB